MKALDISSFSLNPDSLTQTLVLFGVNWCNRGGGGGGGGFTPRFHTFLHFTFALFVYGVVKRVVKKVHLITLFTLYYTFYTYLLKIFFYLISVPPVFT